MPELNYNTVKQHETGAYWLSRIESVCRSHTPDGRIGPYLQFRTDWINEGIQHALQQTLRYVGYGYKDFMIFKDLGRVIGEMLSSIEGVVRDGVI